MADTQSRALFTKSQRLFHQLTNPFYPLPTQEDRQKARLLSVLLLTQMGMAVLLFGTGLIFRGTFNSVLPPMIYLPILGVMYWFSRTRAYRGAARALVLFSALMCFILLANPVLPDAFPIHLLILPIFFAGFMLSFRTTLFVIAVIAVGLGIAPLMISIEPSEYWLAVVIDIAVVSLILISTLVRRYDYDRLRNSELRVHSLMNASNEKVIIYNQHGQILDVNSAAEQLFARSRASLIGSMLIEHVTPSDHEKFRHVMRGTINSTLLTWISALQTSHECQVLTRPYEHSNQKAYVLTAQDVTKERLAERRRIEYERRYEALFNRTADAVLITDLEGRYISVNRQALHMFRCNPGDMIGHNTSEFVDPEEARQDSASNRILAGETLPIYERTFRRKDGSLFTAEVNIMLVKDGDGKALYMQSIVRDVSQRHQIQQQQFEIAVQRERMKILQGFIDDASHYFRTPLTSIKTSAYLMERFGQNVEKQNQHLGMINIQIERLEQLLNDLLMMTRLDREAAEGPNLMRIDMNRMLLQLVSEHMSSDNVSSENHHWEFLPTTDDLIILGDRSRIALALSNILNNACKYTPTNGQIIVKTYRQYLLVVIEISDTGFGMTEEEVSHIFDNFYRTDSARARDSISSGMGLSIAQKIIKMHRGVIHVNSEPGVGSTFAIHLPMAGEKLESESSSSLFMSPSISSL
jgi:PAS domain S-box-containing protein